MPPALPGWQLREALDVHLVDDRLVQLPAQRAVAFPVERVVDDDGFRHERRAVGVVALQVVAAERVGEDRRVPPDVAGDRARVGIDQQLGGVAAMPLRRIPRPWTRKP